MITYLKGDATKPQGDGLKIIVHCCNNVGAWGAGFVLAISKRWPEPEKEFKAVSLSSMKRKETLALGTVQFVPVEEDIIVANLIGQDGLRSPFNPVPLRYDALREGFKTIAELPGDFSIHMPRIGCGLAGGSWDKVEKEIKENLSSIPVFVYDF